jgi:hypothetical protein
MLRRSVSLVISAALGLGPAACKKDEPEATASDAGDAEREAPKETPRATDPPQQYATSVETLLDLVPKGSKAWAIVRDPAGLLELAQPVIELSVPAAKGFAPPSAAAAIDRFTERYAEFRTLLAASKVDLSKGAATFELDGEPAFVFAGESAEDVRGLITKLGGSDLPECIAIAKAAGYFVCAEDAARIAAYAPGGANETLKNGIETALPGVDLDTANVVGNIDATPNAPFVVTTPPGLLHVVLRPPPLDAQVDQMEVAGGPARALGLAAPGGGFVWAKVSANEIQRRSGTAPAIARTLIESFDGEFFIGGLADPAAVVMLIGVEDPTPASGMLSLASMQFDQVPKDLPDGSKLAIELYNVAHGEGQIQAIHAKVTPSDEAAKLWALMGAETDAWSFAAGHYTAVVLGAPEATVTKIAEFEGSGPSPAFLRALPPPLADALSAGKVGFVTHVPFDFVATPAARSLLTALASNVPAGALPGGRSAAALVDPTVAVLAPLSSISSWYELTDGDPLIHLTVSILGDGRTEDGKAALAGLQAIAGGKAPAATYAALVEAHGDSPRGDLYRARQADDKAAMMGSAFLLGVLTSIAVPAFTKYIQRSRAAAAVPPPDAPPATDEPLPPPDAPPPAAPAPAD